MVDIVIELEADACAHTWEQVIAHASELYDSLESYWSPVGTTTLNANPLQAKVASLEKTVGKLKLKEGDPSTSTVFGKKSALTVVKTKRKVGMEVVQLQNP